MALLDLQGLEAPGGHGGGGGGSTLTVLTCGSQRPSNLSVAICH
jgi:lanthionine-containing peptide SapB